MSGVKINDLMMHGDLLLPILYVNFLNGIYNDPNLTINGCGPAGILSFLVPDTYDDIDLNEACNPHDFMYYYGETEKDKDLADRVFLFNLLTVLDRDNPNRRTSRKRHDMAMIYYDAVSDYGHFFFKYVSCTRPIMENALGELLKVTKILPFEGDNIDHSLDDNWWDEEDEHDGG